MGSEVDEEAGQCMLAATFPDDACYAACYSYYAPNTVQFFFQLVEFNGENDHVHLLVTYPPKVAVSHLVNSLKGVSSRLLRKRHGAVISKKLWGNSLWSPSYFAGSCGGAPINIVR